MDMLNVTLMNFAYAVSGAVTTLIFIGLGYKMFDRMTPFDTHSQLEKGNIAVGIVVGSIFIALGLAIGLVIGMGLN